MVLAASLGLVLVYFLIRRRPIRLVDQPPTFGKRQWQAVAFIYGAFLLAALGLAPFRSMEMHSFWAGTAEQLAVMMLVAPLLVLGAPAADLVRLRPRRLRSLKIPKVANGPLAAFLLCNAGFALIHLPGIYGAILESWFLHDLAELGLLAVSFFFWAQVIPQGRVRPRLGMFTRAAYLFAASAQTRVLGLVFAIAPVAFYPHYVNLLGRDGALVDQQIAAGVLIVPGILTDTIALTACLFLWLGEEERKARHVRDPRPGRRVAVATR
jgi:cytochrome c oxidase assembly factor CtaG